jgi:hypothetical protein
MRKELFPIYKQVIKQCIESCFTQEQLQCTYDMMDRFVDRFKILIPDPQLMKAVEELTGAYVQRQSELIIF